MSFSPAVSPTALGAVWRTNLSGLGVRPLMTGALSDGFTAYYGARAAYALILATLTLVPAAWFLARSARTLLADGEA